MDLRQRLAGLTLPPPLEALIQRAVGPGSADRRHEDLVVAAETFCKVVAITMWAVCRHLDLRSREFDRQVRALARPSFGHWTGLLRTSYRLLQSRSDPEVRALAPLFAGLAKDYADDPGTARFAEQLRQIGDGRRLPGGPSVLDLLQALPEYRNKTQSTHYHAANPEFRHDAFEPLLEGLLGLCALAPPIGAFRLAIVHRLERDDLGHSAQLAVLNGTLVAPETCRPDDELWSALRTGRPYLCALPNLFVPLFPLAATESSEGNWGIGWLAGRVHAPTLAYHGSERGRFQIAVDPVEYEEVLGGVDREAALSEEILALPPFRGLLSYDEEHAPLFFGREEETEVAVSRLQRTGTLVICGASGSGKSSLMKAGIVPALRRRAAEADRELVVVGLTPGSEPLAALRRALRAAGPTASDEAARWSKLVSDLLAGTDESADSDGLVHLLRGVASSGREVALCVDQLEELATHGVAAAEVTRFLELLAELATERDEARVVVVMTVRADLVGRLLGYPAFRRLVDLNSMHVARLERSRLERVITEPLRGRSVGIESGLPETIVADVADQPGAIALLSQVLATLWDERAAHGDWLTKQGYDDAGRVTGALRSQADAARADSAATPECERQLDQLLRVLAYHDTEHGFSRRRARLEALAGSCGLAPERVRELLEPFVRRRLVVMSSQPDDAADEVVEVAHEALLDAWPHLAELLRSHREAIVLRQQLEVAAAAWDASGRRRELWSDATSKLVRAEEMIAAGSLWVAPREQEFLASSRAGVRRRRRLEIGVGLGLIVLSATAGLAFLGSAANAREAKRSEQRAEDALARYRQLEDGVLLRNFETRARTELVPPGSERVADMRAWLRDVEAWLRSMPDHKSTLAELRDRGARSGDTWGFEQTEDQFLHDALHELVAGLQVFRAADGTLARVRDDLDWSERVRQETVDELAEDWRAAAARLRAQPRFAGVELLPQEGLVPLGPDPVTGLEEFWFARNGARPERRAGRIDVADETGIVLVLVPGGRTVIGSPPHNPAGGRNYGIEQPRSPVDLDAYFIGKFELTQGQWLRLAGSNPATRSHEAFPGFGLTNPVETVSWRDATAVLSQVGLMLPTEVQWEHACRAGTDSEWWFGSRDQTGDRSVLVGVDGRGRFNAADGFLSRGGNHMPEAEFWPEYDDGFPASAPVGSYDEPNAFGLFDVHGNVAEFTRGPAGRYEPGSFGPGDGVLLGGSTARVIHRGGSYWKNVEAARSAHRTNVGPDAKFDSVGLRVARRLER